MSIGTEKQLTKSNTHSWWKTLSKLGIEENLLNLIKNICKKPTANLILNVQKLKAFPLRSWARQRCPLSSFLFNNILEFLTNAIRQEKGNKHVLICVGLRNTATMLCVLEQSLCSGVSALHLKLISSFKASMNHPVLLSSHFLEEQTEAQKDEVTCPRAHN